ncbi:MAG: DUF1801 domain-containing protein [Thermoleophilia bacterium]|nr:DUF1801 domain-containing protein [Thermoleophilia bacterium]
MSAREIDDYLAGVDEPGRGTLESLRRTILELLPEAEQGLAYGAPVFRIDGTAVGGFAAFKRHLSYLPHSGSVLAALGDRVAGHATSKGSLRFPLDEPLPPALVADLIAARRREIDGT